MPLYDYRCENNHVTEHLVKDSSQQITCSCGASTKRLVSCHAFTPSLFGDQTGRYGVNGYYNKSLGMQVSNQREADRIAASKGYVNLSEYGSQRLDDEIEAQGHQADKDYKNIVAYDTAYDQALSETKNMVTAMQAGYDAVNGD